MSLLAVAFLAATGAQEPRAFLLQIHDPGRLLDAPPTVTLKGASGKVHEVAARDDGKNPDSRAGDGRYCASIPDSRDLEYDWAVSDGARTWTGHLALDPARLEEMTLRFALGDSGAEWRQVQPGVDQERPTPSLDPAAAARLFQDIQADQEGGTGAPRRAEEESASWADLPDLAPGYLLWVFAFTGLGAGAGYLLAGRVHDRDGPVRLSPRPGPTEAPRRLTAADLRAVLAGPLAHRRVLALGPLDAVPGHVQRVLDWYPLPGELVSAVEREAARAGPPVSLLLTAPDLLEASGAQPALDELVALAAGRFPVWVVDGPAGWVAWSPGGGSDTA